MGSQPAHSAVSVQRMTMENLHFFLVALQQQLPAHVWGDAHLKGTTAGLVGLGEAKPGASPETRHIPVGSPGPPRPAAAVTQAA